MPHALTSNLLHCVFSTKDRANSIPDPQALGRYLGGVAGEKNILLLMAGGTGNHVHLLIALPAAMPLAKAIQELKGQQFAMAEPARIGLCLAGGICRFQRQPLEQASRDGIYRRATASSPEAQL